MNSTFVISKVISTLCISHYLYNAAHNIVLYTECKNMSKLLQFFQKDRRRCHFIDPFEIYENLKILKMEPLDLSSTNNNFWYFIIRNNLIDNIVSFLESLLEYKSSSITSFVLADSKTINGKSSDTIYDGINKIHYCVVDVLSKNFKYVNLIKDIYDKYFGYEKNQICEILITHTHNDTLKIIIDYLSFGSNDLLHNFDHIINNHVKYVDRKKMNVNYFVRK